MTFRGFHRFFSFTWLILVLAPPAFSQQQFVYESDQLQIEQLSAHTYRHITWLQTNDFGKVACNGMIVVSDGEALVFDTPTNDADAVALLDWIASSLKVQVKGVVVTHFHDDCLGGLQAFHDRQIPSYASQRTIDLVKRDSLPVPQTGFEKRLQLRVGKQKVINEFFGEGHTRDNIVAYFPLDQALFGGCLIKTMHASKGYLGDANTEAWSATVTKIKKKYPDLQVVVPGHGDTGGTALLDYTIDLFAQ